ncbi:hypothetical protein Mapa_012030 [Marchantia paleacea]|nr:hypothetical protein Mapa_012030 [Marchantia paleacea]
MELEFRTASFRIVIVSTLLTFHSFVYPVSSQSQKGFISINCGGDTGTDPDTTLEWKSDGDFLQAAVEMAEEGVTINATVQLNATAVPRDNAEGLKTALVFYPGNPDRKARSKFCYKLPVEYNSSANMQNLLLRATFPSSNLTTTALDHNGQPISLSAYSSRFYFTVDSTYITTVDLRWSEPQTLELIITAFDEHVYVCLVPLEDRSSMPAISVLELRPLAPDMYQRRAKSSRVESSGRTLITTYLMTVKRWNFGGDPQLPSLRFPSDKYDRLWFSPRMPDSSAQNLTFTRNTSVLNLAPSPDIEMPEEVMSTAVVGNTLSDRITFRVNLKTARSLRPMPTFYLNLMFYELLDNANSSRIVDIYTTQDNVSEWYFKDLQLDQNIWHTIYHRGATFTDDYPFFSLIANKNSTLPALINAAEFYGEFDSVTMRTFAVDAATIAKFSINFLHIVDTAGDPCLPAPWAWTVCSLEQPPRVTQINLTSEGVGGRLPVDFGALSRLTILDLSNNTFRGSFPDSLGEVRTLRALNLGHNKLSGELPPFSPKALDHLEMLSLSNNMFNGPLFSLMEAIDEPIQDIDLSRNKFDGPLPLNIEVLKNLKNLDMSNNQLSSGLTVNFSKLTNLQNLNLSLNNLNGTVPDTIWNSPNLQVVDLRSNSFVELNLTTWHKTVAEGKSLDAPGIQLRLAGNQIHNIISPSLETLESIIGAPPSKAEQLRSIPSPIAFILLGDNPWCHNDHEGVNLVFIKKYMCRSDERENFWPSPSNDGVQTRTLIAVGVVCGTFMLLMSCLVTFFLWKMRRRSRELQQIQEALAKEHVKPPFFNYDELKTATHNFSSYNELGKGGFGTVYKAELADGSVVAVKRLTPTEQNTSDFLKEMVNISGIKHRHLIQLKGCCVREKQRMLIYEYAENKSLAEALFGPQCATVLNWKQRYDICLGIARGIAYLHEELQPGMIHRGYFSPEYATEGIVSEKLDVYSFGIVVLEIVAGRLCIDFTLPHEQIYLRSWAITLYGEGKVSNLVDKRLKGDYDEEEVLLVVNMALSCLKADPKKRATMSQLVNVLMKNSNADVAVDIVNELKNQGPLLESILDDEYDMNTHAGDEGVRGESYELSLISSEANNSQLRQFSNMRPR